MVAPICPHTLSDRPILVSATSIIEVRLIDRPDSTAEVACDGRVLGKLNPGDTLTFRAAGSRITVPFVPGRADATAEQTDADSFAPLEPLSDGFRNYRREGTQFMAPEEALVDRAQNGCAIVHSDSDEGIQRLNQEAAKVIANAHRAGIDIAPAVLNQARAQQQETARRTISWHPCDVRALDFPGECQV